MSIWGGSSAWSSRSTRPGTKSSSWSWWLLMFTLSVIPARSTPARRSSAAWATASCSTHRPSGTMRPLRSAVATMAAVSGLDGCWWRQRSRASAPVSAPLATASRGWRWMASSWCSMAWRRSPSSDIARLASRSMRRSNTRWATPPACLAEYMARSARRNSSSASSAPGLARAIPMLADMRTICSRRWKARSAEATALVATSDAMVSARTASAPRRGSRITNSSPPRRATKSSGRSWSARRPATCWSSRSPREWPRESFTRLNPSRSTNSRATWSRVSEAAARAERRRSWNRPRLASPVSTSCEASSSSSLCAWIRSVMSALVATAPRISPLPGSMMGAVLTSSHRGSSPGVLRTRLLRGSPVAMVGRRAQSSAATPMTSCTGRCRRSSSGRPASSAARGLARVTRPSGSTTMTPSLSAPITAVRVPSRSRRRASTRVRASTSRALATRQRSPSTSESEKRTSTARREPSRQRMRPAKTATAPGRRPSTMRDHCSGSAGIDASKSWMRRPRSWRGSQPASSTMRSLTHRIRPVPGSSSRTVSGLTRRASASAELGSWWSSTLAAPRASGSLTPRRVAAGRSYSSDRHGT